MADKAKRSQKQKRVYTKEFKQEAVQLVLEKGMKQTEAARELGISANLMHRWVLQFRSDGGEAFPGKGSLKPIDQRVRDLESEVKRLRMERDILKKAMGYFVDVPK